jgi:hypothetical protein
MQLDYIDKVNEYGDDVVRLYDFDMAEAKQFRELVQSVVITAQKQLDLSTVPFIEARNCNLILCISDTDEGIIRVNKTEFTCNLTKEGYAHMLTLLEPFCKKETKGYQYLYDVDSPTDFLFSPAGTW